MPPRPTQSTRGEVTREVIIEVAERFWAEHGIHNASLRQISAAAGLSNPSSVQYHFGGREGLVQAVFEYRLPALESRRVELLLQTQARSPEPDLRSLLDCLYRPLMESVDAQGRHAFAGFLRQVLLYEPALLVRVSLAESSPVTQQLYEELSKPLLGYLTPDILTQRVWASSLTMLNILCRMDDDKAALPKEAAYEDALDMVHACLSLPLSRVVSERLRPQRAGAAAVKAVPARGTR